VDPQDHAPQRIARDWISYHKREYGNTSNPVYVWEAMAEALTHDLPLPDWTLDYLKQTAVSMARLSREQIPREGVIARAVAAALGFRRRGRSNPFRDVNQAAHELMIASDVYTTHTMNWSRQRQGVEGTHDWDSVYRDAAILHHQHCEDCVRVPSTGTVERYWRKHALSVIPPHLIKHANSTKIDDILK
jgi:hypothetical protein